MCLTITAGKAQTWQANLDTKAHRDKITEALSILAIDTLKVVISDEQSKEGQSMISSFDKYWKYSKYKFISTDEFKKIYSVEGNFFFTPMTFEAKQGSEILSSNSSFVILKGGNGIKISKNGMITLIESNTSIGLPCKSLVYGINFGMSALGYTYSNDDALYYPIYIACFNRLLSNLVDALEITEKNKDKTLQFYNNTTLDSLKGKTLVIDKSGAEVYSSVTGSDNKGYEDQCKSIYSIALGIPKDKIILLEKEDINKAFESGNIDYIYQRFDGTIFDYKGNDLVVVNTYKVNRLIKKSK